jgi:hypothetical protein
MAAAANFILTASLRDLRDLDEAKVDLFRQSVECHPERWNNHLSRDRDDLRKVASRKDINSESKGFSSRIDRG